MGLNVLRGLSQKEENKCLQDRLSNAYAIKTKSFGMASFGGSAPAENRQRSVARSEHSKRNTSLVGIALLAALLVCLALLLLHW